ncbi:MAG: hypothetical protein IKJ83_03025 [Ruminococcus sp.]|nr:hypothetical protein [Ruminococcus sp.]
MKKLGKILSVILIMLILVFSIISVFGFSYYVGDNKTTVIRGFDDLNFGSDISGGTKMTIKVASDDEPEIVAEIIEKRATSYGLKDYELYIQKETDEVVFSVPDDLVSAYDAVETAAFMTATGYVTIRPDHEYFGVTVDSSGGPAFIGYTGDTGSTIILNSKHITGAEAVEFKDSGNTYYCVDIKLNDEGTFLLSQISDPNGGAGTSYYNQTISLWIDDRMISFRTLEDHIDNGVLSFTDDDMTEEKAKLYASIIKFGTIPGTLTVSSIDAVEPVSGDSLQDMLLIIGAASLVILAFALIYRYKSGGGIILVSALFQFSVLLAFFTKFFDKKEAFLMNLPAFGAYALTVIMTVFSLVTVFEKVRKSVTIGTKLSDAIISGFKAAKTRIFDINMIFVLISVSALIIFGTNGFATTLFGYTLSSGIYRFCDVMLFGSILNFASGYFLPLFITKNVMEFKFLSKPSMLGGKCNEN